MIRIEKVFPMRTAGLILAAAALSGCASNGPSVSPQTAPSRAPLEYVKEGMSVTFLADRVEAARELNGLKLVFDRWTDFSEELVATGDPVMLRFDESRMIGTGPCNSIEATYTTDKVDRLSFGPIARSKRACASEVLNEVEDGLIEFLGKVDSFEMSGSWVVLKTPDQRLMLLWTMDADAVGVRPTPPSQ